MDEEAERLSIGEAAERTGVAEGTLRMWEHRHGFPAPGRLTGGHRRYSEHDLELIRRVAADRDAGLSVAAAVQRARTHTAREPNSVYAALRSMRPDLTPQALTKPLLLTLTRAIEDETLSRAERPLVFGSFQQQGFYRRSEHRWRELARTARLVVAFADFPRRRTARGAPVELPVRRDHPLTREWAIVCHSDDHGVCLAAWERPGASAGEPRLFETVWSVEPEVVREAARVCAEIAMSAAPAVITPVREQLEASPLPTAGSQLRLAAAIVNRTLSYLA